MTGPTPSDAASPEAGADARPGGPDAPLPVREVSGRLAGWIERLGRVWVEGQITQLTVRPGASLAFATLRDVESDVSVPVAVPRSVLAAGAPPAEGARVVALVKPQWWARQGRLVLMASVIRPVGLGELLARLEHLKGVLAAEGLFARERKRPLPFLPRTVGLVCGRASAALTDVVENARLRWPGVVFEVREVVVQGPAAAAEVAAAVRELDAMPEVDVIVVTRGGGSFEDLLPFSDEGLVRAVAAAMTPVVSAIGHEQDAPLLDLVADLRASTPTDAARRVVPDVREERALVGRWRDTARGTVVAHLVAERRRLAVLRGHPALRDPGTLLGARAREVAALRERGRRDTGHQVQLALTGTRGLAARLRALSPQGTLDRGYAVVRDDDGHVLRSPAAVAAGARLRVRLAEGELTAVASAPAEDGPADDAPPS